MMSVIVKQIDHILVASHEAKKLFRLLSETLQLPVVWPMSDYGGFSSGGVAVGNVNIEVLRGSESAIGAPKSRFIGFALEPAPLQTSLPELDVRRIAHESPRHFARNSLMDR
jgi:hypothetical protein